MLSRYVDSIPDIYSRYIVPEVLEPTISAVVDKSAKIKPKVYSATRRRRTLRRQKINQQVSDVDLPAARQDINAETDMSLKVPKESSESALKDDFIEN